LIPKISPFVKNKKAPHLLDFFVASLLLFNALGKVTRQNKV
jgi:hypothetical protein